jgi:hypothetical protein
VHLYRLGGRQSGAGNGSRPGRVAGLFGGSFAPVATFSEAEKLGG